MMVQESKCFHWQRMCPEYYAHLMISLAGRLQKLRIDSYRSLRDVRLEQLGRINLLVGANNTGKTSVLEAIGLVARPFEPSQWVQTATNRDASGSLVDGLWSLFPSTHSLSLDSGQEASKQHIIISGSFDEERSLRAYAVAFTEQWADIDRPVAETQTDTIVRIHVVMTIGPQKKQVSHEMEFRSTPRRVSVGHDVLPLRTFTVTPITHRSTQQIIAHLSSVIDQGVKEKCVALLRIFDPAIEDVEISRPLDRDAIRVRHKHKGVVDLATFGDGMRRAFAMSIAMVRAKGGILLVDEIESAIHARALDVVLPWLVHAAEEMDVQVIATTHSLEAVDAVLGAFKGAEPEKVITYHLRRGEKGHTCSRYDLIGLQGLREEGLDIR